MLVLVRFGLSNSGGYLALACLLHHGMAWQVKDFVRSAGGSLRSLKLHWRWGSISFDMRCPAPSLQNLQSKVRRYRHTQIVEQGAQFIW